jgi:hypothetical protein
MSIPRHRVCKNHVAPYDFVYDAFVGKWKLILAKANRAGGKTINFAILDILWALANDNCEIANVAAIKPQTQRCYRYVQGFANQSNEIKQHVTNSILSRTDYDTGSVLDLLTATVSGVNSPHPQKYIADEVELFNWFILQQSMNMVKSKGDIKGQTILGSTQKYVSGPMQRLITESMASGKMKFYEWCIWDVMTKPRPEMMEEIRAEFGDDLPEDIEMADGFYDWDDLIATHSTLDKEIWETEWLCKRPQSGGLVYPKFSDERNVETNFKLDPSKLFIFEDFGYAIDHPDVVLFAQVDQVQQTVIIFDELYSSLKGTEQIVEAVKSKLQQYGLTVANVRAWIGDPHGLTENVDRFNLGLPMVGHESEWKVDNPELYKLNNSIPLVRKMIDEGWLKITPVCTQLRGEFMMYSKVKQLDGIYKKDEAEKKWDHGPDATRYGLIKLFPTLAFASFSVTKERAAIPRPAGYNQPITAGLRSRTF